MAMWRLHIACWLPKATNRHSVCVILMAFPLQHWLHERASKLRYTYFACLGYPRLQSVAFVTVFAVRYLDLQKENCSLVQKTPDKHLLV
jgi:hypothetical protein